MNITNLLLAISIFLFPLMTNADNLHYPKNTNEAYRLDSFYHISKNSFSNIDSFRYNANILEIEKDYSALLTTNLHKVNSTVRYLLKNKRLITRISANRITPSYWKTVHSVESKQGAFMYRPRNRAKNCRRTKGPCGHHQLTVQALRDIGCWGKHCKKDRENYTKSLKMSKKLLRLNERRLQMGGLANLPEYQKYLTHQQGAAGIKAIITASLGKRHLSRKIERNMANNSPYSYRSLKRMGSRRAANAFLRFWKSKWKNEKRLVSLDHRQTNKNNLLSQYEIHYVLNEILGNEKKYQ